MASKLIILLLLVAGSVSAQLNNPAFVASLSKPAAAGGGGGGLSWSHLTSGSDTTTEPTSTASITPTANADVFVSIVVAVAGGGTTKAADTMSVSGCNLTWTQVAEIPYKDNSDRRSCYVWHGKGASPTTGVLTLAFTPDSGTWTEHMWIVDQVTGAHTSSPYSNVATVGYTTGGTSVSVTVGGTVDSGDHVFFMCGHETDEAVTLEASLTSLAAVTGGSDCRTINAGYDGTPTIDQTPSASWSSSSGYAAIAFIVEVAP